MRTIRMLSCALLVGAMAVVTPGGAASAAPPTTYTGVFGPNEIYATIHYEGCTTGIPPVGAEASGPWSMTLHGTSAKGSFNILVNGETHVAYVYPGMKQAPVGSAYAFSVHGVTQAGLLTVNLKVDGNMTYTIAPYTYGGLTCDSVTYPGHT